MEMHYSVGQQSHQGGRDYNEDSTAIFERENAVLLVVADGLGGHEGGEVASQCFVEAMGDSFKKATPAQLEKAQSFLTLSINFAHHSIHRRAVAQGLPVESPKTTCVVCLIYKGIAHWAHSGDSRLYLIRRRQSRFITEDHVSQKAGRKGNAPINRCVGGLEAPRPEVSEPRKMREGDVFFLATDGAWACFDPEDLSEYVDPQHPSLGLDSLLQTLENRNKAPSDNLSVVVLFWAVKQLDNPEFNEFDEPDTVELLDQSIQASRAKEAPTTEAKPGEKKFDMKDLNEAINEIESFISDLDDQL
ncbi:protein phosphatase 2C domain-containing protein [Arenicella sp. 4NH20-0111]|uniref:PP2C family protein-serine/threonine phosphatase n=1 Tax=Arenicella sp. 4NH20-0111 TaxID=3127648 RepID=UPI00310AE2F0